MTCDEMSTSPARRARNVLLVDDEAAFRDVLAHVLTDEGYCVRVASNGLEALSSLRLGLPGLVILDLMMPRLDGHEVLAAMARDPALARVPVLVLSGSEPSRVKRSGASVVGFVKKPVNLEALLQKVAAVL